MTDWALVAAKGDEGPQGPNEIPAGLVTAPGLPVHSDPNTGLWSAGADIINVSTAGVERLRADASGNIGLNASSFGTSAAKVVGIGDGTAPSTSPADMVQLYSENGILRVRDEAGFINQLSGMPDAMPGGRLSLRSDFPQSDIELITTNAQTLYYQPYVHNRVMLWNGSCFVPFQINVGAISLSLAGLTTTFPYDIFLQEVAGVPTMSAVQWSSSGGFTRGAFNGIPCRFGDTTKLYLGTIQMQATGQTEDSYSRRFVWNYYNKIQSKIRKFETTATWANSGTSFRSLNGSTANRIEVVSGDYFSLLDVTAYVSSQATAGTPLRRAGIGIDSTSATTVEVEQGQTSPNTAGLIAHSWSRVQSYLLGYHFIQALECASGTCSFQGSGTAGCCAGIMGVWSY